MENTLLPKMLFCKPKEFLFELIHGKKTTKEIINLKMFIIFEKKNDQKTCT